MKKSLIFLLSCLILTASFSLEAKATQHHHKKSAKFSQNGISHIKQRHWYKANSGPNTSHFNRSMTVKKLDAIATKTISQGTTRYSQNGNGNKTHDYRFKKPIGTKTNGSKAYSMRVVTNPKGEVVTAFPR